MRDNILILSIAILFLGCTQPIKVKLENNNFTKENALHDAVRAKDIELINILIDGKIDINLQNKYGYTPLHLAIRTDDLDIVNLLIKKNAKINTIDRYKDTPLLDAIRNNNTKIAEVLICNGAYRNVKDKNGMSTLNHSTKHMNTYISKLLISDNFYQFCNKKTNIQKLKSKPSKSDKSITDEKLETNKELYKSLIEEFENNFSQWQASIEKDTLRFKFKNSTVLFEPLQTNLNQSFKFIIDDFFPRYLDVLLYFKDNIDKVYIEGYSSFEYSKANSIEEKFKQNKILSQQRADETLRYIKESSESIVIENFSWITTTFSAIGKSSENLILNENGSENKKLSRRIEFIIKLKQQK